MVKRTRLDALAGLASTIRDAELAKVATVVGELTALRSSIRRIEGARSARVADGALDPSRLSGADLAWERWGDARLRSLQSRHAALRAEHETALADARLAFGRAEVLTTLSARHAKARRSKSGD